MTSDTRNSPLVIFGLDVGDPEVIRGWAQGGYLPTIASLMKRGCWGRAAGPELVCEHGTWLSLFSGISRGQHGYYHFRQLKPGTYELQPFTTRDTGVFPFWAHLRGTGKKVAIIDAPETEPMPGLLGLQVADWATHEPTFPPATEPPRLLQEIRSIFGPQMTVGEMLNSTFDDDKRIYYGLLKQIDKKGALCRELLSRDSFDLVVIVFAESHTASHQFWKYLPEAQRADSSTGESELTNAIRDVYQAIDRQMGLLFGQLPATANTFVLSLLAMQNQYPTTGLMESFCQQLGYQAPAELSPSPLTLVRRLVPKSWRVALSRHLPRGAQESLLTSQLQSGTNWRKTTAFAIPGWDMGYLRVNLRGREPQGIVEPEAEYKAVLDRLEWDLDQLIDPVTDESPLKRVTRTADLYGIGPPDTLPDLFVEWKPSPHFREQVIHPRAVLVQQKHTLCPESEETPTGFIGAAGPSIYGRGDLGDILLLDLAPTFLYVLSEAVSHSMTGKVIEAMTAARRADA